MEDETMAYNQEQIEVLREQRQQQDLRIDSVNKDIDI